ncbi:hypothetical protein GGQ74_003062 [Desulfobaculum xiamenense]|uniref:Metallophosphoesterase TT1561-like domain-containing protein n=1 Tax=Desulfobaculum xiamenense TaxID=995050 RepID=A0A846QQU7_9BACT|nr:metallophosphoesterase [Desulfobaculum xiamenense]NJB69360.1 hypothetical protein [Desulfobaculum xiamenense]
MDKFERFWIGCGDIHGDPRRLAEIPGVAGAEGIILSGDLTTNGGLKVAREVIETVRGSNPRIYAQIGNMDAHAVTDWLEERDMNIHARVRELAPGAGIIGVGCSSPTPFRTPCEVPDSQLAAWLDAAHSAMPDWAALLLVSHDPPYGTSADELPGGMHVGSRAVRAFIERVQPDVCLCGHIHEARTEDMIGRTRIVNPGMLAHGGYAVIGLVDGRFTAKLRVLD